MRIKVFNNKSGNGIYVAFAVQETEKSNDYTKISEPIKEVLKNYLDIFECPTALPPSTNRNHFINTMEGAKLVSVRPYRYP